jgi:hypothetical protein
MKDQLYDREGAAGIIRIMFVEKKKGLLGGVTYTPNPRHDTRENWLRAADNCLRLNANPRDFVDAAFALCPAVGGPFANQLVGASAESWYRTYTGDRVKRSTGVYDLPEDKETPDMMSASVLCHQVKREIELAHILMMQITGSPDAWMSWKVLMDHWTSIAPYIRVAIAGKARLVSIVKKFAPQATEYLSTRPGHVQALQYLGYDINAYLNAATNNQR